MTVTLDDLIEQVDTTKVEHIKHITSEQVRAVIEYGHIHLNYPFPEYKAYGKSGIVIAPDKSVHTVQITIAGRDREKNNCNCMTCWPNTCPAVVAAFIVELAKFPGLQETEPQHKCPVCEAILA